MRPEAEMLAEAEGEMPIRSAVDAELLCILEDGLIPVRRGEEQGNGLPCPDGPPPNRDIRRGGPHQVAPWRGPAQDLLDRTVEQGHVCLQPRQLDRILH